VAIRVTTLLCLLALLMPARATAQENPFGPIPQSPAPQQPAPAPAPPPAEEDEGLSDRQQLLIALAGAVLVVGIAWAIIRDARRTAPAEEHMPIDQGGTTSHGTRPPKRQRVAQGRAKAKAARKARRKTRKKR
jgi:hypothetical protein